MTVGDSPLLTSARSFFGAALFSVIQPGPPVQRNRHRANGSKINYTPEVQNGVEVAKFLVRV